MCCMQKNIHIMILKKNFTGSELVSATEAVQGFSPLINPVKGRVSVQ